MAKGEERLSGKEGGTYRMGSVIREKSEREQSIMIDTYLWKHHTETIVFYADLKKTFKIKKSNINQNQANHAILIQVS